MAMTLHEALNTITNVQFDAPRQGKSEPPTLIFAFADKAVGHLAYEQMIKTFKNDELRLQLYQDYDELMVSFHHLPSNEYFGHFTVKYNKKEIEEFTTNVKPNDKFVLAFGFVDQSSRMVITPADEKFTILLLNGYDMKNLSPA